MEDMVTINNYFWLNRRVLVTGHTGFKGSWLSLWLSMLGAKICGISLEKLDQYNLFSELNLINQISYHNICDIRNLRAIKKIIKEFQPEIIFHLAAQPLVITSYNEPINTWETNVLGTVNILESLKVLKGTCAAVLVTTDKVYKNKEQNTGYQEQDTLGGYDPYSSSKAAAELAIESWRSSFFKDHKYNVRIASARAGNVIGGGDWTESRLIPDIVNSIIKKDICKIRNSAAIRPWQHVLEPLSGYLILAEKLFTNPKTNNIYCSSYNFGPNLDSHCEVKEVIKICFDNWKGYWEDCSNDINFHETKKLNLQIKKAKNELNWIPIWDINKTIEKTINWYKYFYNKSNNAEYLCMRDIEDFQKEIFKTGYSNKKNHSDN